MQRRASIITPILSARLFALLFLSLLAFYAKAVPAAEYNFTHYETRDGLPQIQVLTVHQGPDGYLWVGTYGGLSRYNGEDFTSYQTRDGLNSNFVTALATGHDGRLWVGTAAGLCHRRAEAFHCLDSEELPAGRVYEILPDPAGLWVASDAGLFRIESGSVVAHRILDDDEDPVVSAIARDGEGKLWVANRHGLHQVDGETVRHVSAPAIDGALINDLLWIDQGPRRGMWIGANQGLFRFQPGSDEAVRRVELPTEGRTPDVGQMHVDNGHRLWLASNRGVLRSTESGFERLGLTEGLPTTVTFHVMVDREGVAWMGHDNGLSKLVPGPFAGYTAEAGLINSFIRAINEDERQRLWLGTRSGLQIIPRIDGEWRVDASTTLTEDQGLPDRRIYSIAYPAPGEALIATNKGVARWRNGEGVVETINESDGLPGTRTLSLYHDDHDRTWIGTPRGVAILENGEVRIPEAELLQSAYPYRMIGGPDGRIWLATEQHGLLIHEPGGDTTQLTAEDGLSDEALWDMDVAADGAVWVGSNGDGLFRVGPGGDIRRYTERDGLVDDFVWQVLVDDTGNIWAYTNRGLSRFDGDVFRNYGERDGLLHLEGGATGALQTSDGQLWFASADGLMRYDPRREYVNDTRPLVHLESVLADGQAIESDSEIPHQTSSLELHYAGLSYQDESAVRFRYRLNGLNEEWSPLVSRRHVTYANLNGGTYTFQVEARNPHGVWSAEPATFTFSVTAPYWSRVEFWALVIALLTLLLWGAYGLRMRQVEASRRALERQVEDRTRELAAANRQLEEASVTDPMTGLFNRRFLMKQINADVAQVRRSHLDADAGRYQDLVFMMVDLDHFKSINDRWGHAAGDRVLRAFAGLIQNELRESDYVVRWGGEEFLIVARQAESGSSGVIAQRILEATRDFPFQVNDGDHRVSCSCSIGIAHLPFLRGCPEALGWEQVLDIADMGVYCAKTRGRNRWVRLSAGPALSAADCDELADVLAGDLDEYVRNERIQVEEGGAD